MQYGASLVARRETTMATTTAMMARHMTRWTKKTRSMTTKTWAKMEPVMIMATQATSAAAGMKTSVPFHVAARGDLVGPEAVDLPVGPEAVDLLVGLEAAVLRHLPRAVRVDHRAGIHYCLSIRLHHVAKFRGIRTWSLGPPGIASA